MSVRKGIGIACLLIAVAAAGCLWFLSGKEEAVEGTVIEKDTYFRVVDKGDGKYLYTVYNAEGKAVREEEKFREPMISYIDSETIEIYGGAGTGVWFCVYYDIVHDRFSESFECPAAAKYQKVAFPECREEESVLVIRDMFDAKNCYQGFPLDFGKVVTPVVSAEFKSEDTLLITYESGEFYGDQEKTKLLHWSESEEKADLAEEIPVCDIVRAMDFTVKESHIDITPEENRVYLEGYLKVLKNEIPAIGEVEVKYYKDLWKAGIEFEELLKEKETEEYPYLYYYDDLDGDGKPEFAINQGCMFLFKYEPELNRCTILDFEESCYFKTIVGPGLIWRHDGLHADVVRDDLIGLDKEGNFEEILRLEEGVNPKHPYFEVGVSDTSLQYADEIEDAWKGFETPFLEYADVSEEEWREITEPFFEMVENNAVPKKTLEEVFGELLEEETQVNYVDDKLYAQIKDIYHNIDLSVSFEPGDVTKYDLYKEKFKRLIRGETTAGIRETGEEWYIYEFHAMEQFRTAIELGEFDIKWHSYYFFDINGDRNPELCIQNAQGYLYIFQYDEEQNHIFLWKEYISSTISLMGTRKLIWAGGWAGHGMIRLNENGDRVFFVHFKETGGDYGYLVFLPEYIEFTEKMKEQAIYDETDEEYCFRVTEEQYEELTKRFYDADHEAHAALDEVTYTYGELFE